MDDGAVSTLRDVTTEEFRRSARVLDKNETRRERIWKECVVEAQALVVMHDELRFKIVDLANRCCVIHYGGSSVNARYTVKRFAAEVGITYKTLIEWMRIKKKVFDHLSEEQRDGRSLTELRNLDRELLGFKGTEVQLRKAVQTAFKRHEKMSESTIKMKQYIKNLNALVFNVRNPKMIRDCDEAVLAEIIHLCREIASGLSYIDKKTKASR